MKKFILFLLLISNTVIAQDKGKFEDYNNLFYEKILNESKEYNNQKNDKSKSFKMIIDNKKIPKSLEEFTIINVEDPISQGNTGTCWCF